MSTQPHHTNPAPGPAPNPAPEPPPEPGKTDDQLDCQGLRLIIDIGVRHIQKTDPAHQPTEPPTDPYRAANTYDRLARNVRGSMTLRHKLANPKPATNKPTTLTPTERTTARKRILRNVENAINCRVPERGHADAVIELYDRLDSEDMEHELTTRAAEDIAKDVIRDLGLAPLPSMRLWKRRSPHDVNDLHDFAAKPRPPNGHPPNLKSREWRDPDPDPTPPPTNTPTDDTDDDTDAPLHDDIRLAQALLATHDPPKTKP